MLRLEILSKLTQASAIAKIICSVRRGELLYATFMEQKTYSFSARYPIHIPFSKSVSVLQKWPLLRTLKHSHGCCEAIVASLSDQFR